MALSTDELAYVRSMLPTYAVTDPAYVTDAQLNYLYANKADSDVDAVIALALQQMCIKLSSLVARTNNATGDTVQSQQERESVCDQAKQWAKMAGVLGGVVTAGSISLGIDEEDETVTNP